MKYVLLIFTLAGLTACSVYISKNTTEGEISANGKVLDTNECAVHIVFFGVLGDTTISFKTVGDNPTQVGDKAEYPAGHYVVRGVTKNPFAVQSVETEPDCPEVNEELETAKQAVVEIADEAVQVADLAIAIANSAGSTEAAVAAKTAAETAKSEAEAAKTEAEAATTVEEANAAKAKAEAARTAAHSAKANAEAAKREGGGTVSGPH